MWLPPLRWAAGYQNRGARCGAARQPVCWRASSRRIPIPRTDNRSSELAAARWWTDWPAAGLAITLALVGIHCGLFWNHVNDDAFITFRYSGFLALGRGPYFNVGEHVEGYTNFLLMLLLAPVYRLGGPAAVPVAAKVVGVASGVGSALLAWATTRLLARQLPDLRRHASALGIAAAALLAASPAYALNSTSGLATTLFGFLLILGVFLMLAAELRRAWRGAGLAFAALVLTRPEGPYLFGLAWLAAVAAVAWRRRARQGSEPARSAYRRLLLDAGIVAAVFAAQLAFRVVAYDGEWLPNTYYAKAEGFWKVDAWSYLRAGLLDPCFGPIGVALAVAGAALAVARERLALPLFCAAAAGGALPFITGTDWMLGWRVLMPVLPLTACAVVIGWACVLARLLPPPGWAVPAGVVAAALTLGLLQLPLHATLNEKVSLRSRGYATGHRALAEWLCSEAAAPGDRIALMDVGIVGYRCIDHPILDISGLTDRRIAKSEGSFLRKQYPPEYILAKQPRFIVLVLTAAGRPYEPPPPGQKFGFWTRVERRLYRDEGFQRRYVRRAPPGDVRGDWLSALAQRMGALRIFEHAHPGAHYLLAVFEAQTGEPAADGAAARPIQGVWCSRMSRSPMRFAER